MQTVREKLLEELPEYSGGCPDYYGYKASCEGSCSDCWDGPAEPEREMTAQEALRRARLHSGRFWDVVIKALEYYIDTEDDGR